MNKATSGFYPFVSAEPAELRRLNLFGGSGEQRPKRLIGQLLIALTLTFGGLAIDSSAVIAASNSDAELERLEQKFFQHSYPKDDLTTRVERLEKMVFGENKTGSDSERLAKLIEAVPPASTGPVADTTASGDEEAEAPVAPPPRKNASNKPSANATKPADDSDQETAARSASDEKYPAVSAIEQKVFGRDYASDPVDARLTRLEAKVFGRPSHTTDMSERVDALKQRTGVDLALERPRGSDWSDEDDDEDMAMQHAPAARDNQSSDGADGTSFSGRNLRQDMNSAFGTRSGGSGSYGFGNSGMAMGAGSIDPSGFYGAGGQGMAGSQPYYRKAPPVATETGLGLNQQVTALEGQVFGKTYAKDTLPARLTRLEVSVFPQEKAAVDMSLPDRVARLEKVIPIDNVTNRRIAQRRSDDPYADLDDMQQQAPHSSGGGFSKIFSSLGNMIGGGNSGFTRGYPMQPGALITDPQTGMLLDPTTGNLIDPNTGAIVGRRVTNYGSNYGYGSPGVGFGGIGGFNNGFSPYGTTPYGGYNRGINFGFGRGGFWP